MGEYIFCVVSPDSASRMAFFAFPFNDAVTKPDGGNCGRTPDIVKLSNAIGSTF